MKMHSKSNTTTNLDSFDYLNSKENDAILWKMEVIIIGTIHTLTVLHNWLVRKKERVLGKEFHVH